LITTSHHSDWSSCPWWNSSSWRKWEDKTHCDK